MDAEWDETFNRPEVAQLLKLAEAQYVGHGPRGASVTVDGAGAIVALTPGTDDAPATAASDIVTACNQALQQSHAAAQRYIAASGSVPDEVLAEVHEFDEPVRDKELHRAEALEGMLVATVDANTMELVELFLPDLEESTLAAIPQAISAAFADARGGAEVAELDTNIQATLNEFSASLNSIQAELDIINDRLTEVDNDLRSE
uniref:hypothetical protein n=1 Tax=Tessaracoccus timonensis TaxID=2161816 RepID=UPI000D55A85E|nr:hypothetical protein [Tessaracoccus timonensis]